MGKVLTKGKQIACVRREKFVKGGERNEGYIPGLNLEKGIKLQAGRERTIKVWRPLRRQGIWSFTSSSSANQERSKPGG